jgi:hypothetical protein
MDSDEVEDTVFDGYVEMLATLSDTQIRSLVHARVPAAPERRAFESASEGVSRETLILLGAGCLARQKIGTPVTPSSPFPAWFRPSPT